MNAYRHHRALLAAAFFASVALGLSLAPAAAADQSQITVNDRAEAWYGGAPVANCSSPVGCPPVTAPSSYPADTLHVGVVGGSETARTYLALDLSALPPDARVASGTLSLPVSTESNAGNVNESSATPVVCLAAAAFPDGARGTGTGPPGIDCSVQVAATYHPAASSAAPETFTADLTKFFRSWSRGTPDFGLAVIPAPGQSSNAAWQVAFNTRTAQGLPHISATLDFSVPSTGSPAVAGPAAPSRAQPPASGAPPAAALPALVTPTAPAVLPPAIAPAAPAATPVANGTALPRRLMPVPWPFLWLPLIALILAVYTVRTFIRPVIDGRDHGFA